jgi:hypothetical protein
MMQGYSRLHQSCTYLSKISVLLLLFLFSFFSFFTWHRRSTIICLSIRKPMNDTITGSRIPVLEIVSIFQASKFNLIDFMQTNPN